MEAWRREEPTTTEIAEEGTAAYRLGHGHLGGSSERRGQKSQGGWPRRPIPRASSLRTILRRKSSATAATRAAERRGPPVAGDERLEATAAAREKGREEDQLVAAESVPVEGHFGHFMSRSVTVPVEPVLGELVS